MCSSELEPARAQLRVTSRVTLQATPDARLRTVRRRHRRHRASTAASLSSTHPARADSISVPRPRACASPRIAVLALQLLDELSARTCELIGLAFREFFELHPRSEHRVVVRHLTQVHLPAMQHDRPKVVGTVRNTSAETRSGSGAPFAISRR